MAFILTSWCKAHKREVGTNATDGITVNSWFKKVHVSFLKSRVVWFKTDLCSESKSRSSEKMPYVGKFATWDLS